MMSFTHGDDHLAALVARRNGLLRYKDEFDKKDELTIDEHLEYTDALAALEELDQLIAQLRRLPSRCPPRL